jgi:hypothetical protein
MAVVRPVPALELRLLRKSVGRLAAERERCADCGRTPLLGEHLHVYEGGRVRCELCRERRGERPVRSEPVRGSEHGQAVRLRPAA